MRCAPLAGYPHFRDVLAKWSHQEWGHLYPDFTEDNFREEFAIESTASFPRTLLALDGERLLGTVSLIRNDLPGREDLNPWLASLFVRPDLRGRGVASFLIREAEDVFRKLGVSEAFLFTESAAGLFQKMGWEFFEPSLVNRHEVSIFRKRFEK